MTHANHQGEPGDTGTGWALVPRVLNERMRKTLHSSVSIRCYLDKREASILNDQAWWEAVLAAAPVPAPGANDAVELSRLAELSEAATPGAWHTVDTPWGDGTWLVAGNPDPHAGTMVCDCQDVNETRPEDGPDAADDAAFIAASVNYVRKLIRSGKLVASTGSGKEETKGACLTGYAEFTPISVRSSTGAPASPSGHSRAEPSGLGASPECPSRGPSAPGVLWSAWSETDADSDPSDPGVTYCTEWFVGRWPVGAEEPDCRILIGTSRSAEIIARRIAEKLTSILNTDRLHSADAESPLDTLRPMSEAPTGVPIIARHKPNAAMPDGWVATIKLGHGDDEAAGCYDTILHYNGEESFRDFRGMWTGWLPMGALAGEARRAETEGLGSRASDGEAGTPDLLSHLLTENTNLRDRVREAEKGRPPVVEFHQQDWIPGFAAFLPGATTPQPDSRAFCVLNLGSMLSTVANGDVPASDLPGFVVESMIHEVGHVLEQWAGVEFSEERVEALCDRYRATINSEQEAGDHEPR